ncbi:MAG: hypothetical protein RI996_572 [Candidatus Parcubacteria bacterium]|jgi:hypothetical protein
MQEYIVVLHVAILILTALVILWSDHLGYSWIRGQKKTLDAKVVSKLHRYVWIGLALMIATGATLAYPMRDYLLSNPRFYVKMGYVGMLIINGVAIGVLSKTAMSMEYKNISKKQKMTFFAVGAISTFAWIGATLGGIFLIAE